MFDSNSPLIKPYIVNTGYRDREVYACCPCGWTGTLYPAEDSARAERDGNSHYTARHAR